MGKEMKNIQMRLKALKMGLNALRNANNHFAETKDFSYMLTIQSQLRGLVGMGGKHMNPLLISLAKELEIELEFYAFTSDTDRKKRSSSTVMGKTWSAFKLGGFKRFELSEWLLIDDYFAIGSMNFKNRNQIIKDVSNTEGGTHYGDEKEHIVTTLEKERAGDVDNLTATLLDIGELVFYLGYLLIFKYEYKKIENLKVITNNEKNRKLLYIKRLIGEHEQRFSDINNYGRFNGVLTAYSE